MILVQYEMRWTVKYFIQKGRLWEGHGIEADHEQNHGAAAYAARKAVMWRDLATLCEKQFHLVNPSYHI